jgi:hypothetical protein
MRLAFRVYLGICAEWWACDVEQMKSEAGMEWGQIVGVFGWQLALAILPASAWLIICRLIPGLRRRVGISYCVAAAFVIMSCLFSRNGFSLAGLLAEGIVCALLIVRWRRALKHRSLEINTIISYDDHGQI